MPPTNLECRLAVVSDGLAGIADLASFPQTIAAHLFAGSHQDIILNCTGPTQIINPVPAGHSVSALDLHNMLLWENKNPPNQPLKRVSILFAHSYNYGNGNILGIMFDRGFTTDDDKNGAPVYLERPRQGCAVFLGSIAAHRIPAERNREALFTTIHEVGHMFNLQHEESIPNFLHSSAPAQSFPDAYYHFTSTAQAQLQTCSTSKSVMPGESIFGSGAAVNTVRRRRRSDKPPLELKIAIGRDVFFRFEPTQLEIEIRTTDPAGAEIPAIIDPAADGFSLMIENARGERHLYRPPTRTCGVPETIRVTTDTPYRRDLPLFGQSGGYTFSNAGRHKLWIILEWPGGRLKSNVLHVDVKREINLSSRTEECKEVVADSDVGQLLFHRQDLVSSRGILRLGRYLDQTAEPEGQGELYYALARAISRQGDGPTSSDSKRKRIEQLLLQSLRDGEKSDFQTERRETALAALA